MQRQKKQWKNLKMKEKRHYKGDVGVGGGGESGHFMDHNGITNQAPPISFFFWGGGAGHLLTTIIFS